jgi:hypothetical protein
MLGLAIGAGTTSYAFGQSADLSILQSGGDGLRGTAAQTAQSVPDDVESPVSKAENPDNPINYGRPRPKKPKLFTPKSPLLVQNPRVATPLPPVVPYATAPNVKKRRGAAAAPPQDSAQQGSQPGPTVAVIPFNTQPRKLNVDADPFVPLGIDAGSLRLFPFVELGAGYDTNPNHGSQGVKGSLYGRADGGLDVKSQWDNHSLTATLRGGYSDYIDFHLADRPDFQGKVNGRVDVTRDTQIDLETRGTIDTLAPGSQQLAVPGSSFIIGRPLIDTYGASAGVTQRFDRLSVRLRGTYDHLDYQDANLSNGAIQRYSLSDYDDVGENARISYELTPGLVPYVDATVDQRRYDSGVDSSGYARSSNGIAAKAGSTFEISRILTGDLAGGYVERNYKDQRLENAQGPTLDGNISWTPSDLTKITLSTATDFVETTLPGASAAISRRVSLQATHNFFRNFSLTAIGSYQVNNYEGQPVTEHYYSGSLLAEYSLTREIVIRGTYRHDRFETTQLNQNYSADVLLVGIRLQR